MFTEEDAQDADRVERMQNPPNLSGSSLSLNQDDKQKSPKVSLQGSPCHWKNQLIPICAQVVDQQPDGTPSNPPEQETGSQDDIERPQYQPRQDDERNSPNVAGIILSLKGRANPNFCTGHRPTTRWITFF